MLALASPGTSRAASVTAPIIVGAAADNSAQVLADMAVLGRHMERIRDYNSWDSTPFGVSQLWMRGTGHTVFMSIKAQLSSRATVTFADIAAAPLGSQLYSQMAIQAAQIKAFGALVYLGFDHEPDASTASGKVRNSPPRSPAGEWRTRRRSS